MDTLDEMDTFLKAHTLCKAASWKQKIWTDLQLIRRLINHQNPHNKEKADTWRLHWSILPNTWRRINSDPSQTLPKNWRGGSTFKLILWKQYYPDYVLWINTYTQSGAGIEFRVLCVLSEYSTTEQHPLWILFAKKIFHKILINSILKGLYTMTKWIHSWNARMVWHMKFDQYNILHSQKEGKDQLSSVDTEKAFYKNSKSFLNKNAQHTSNRKKLPQNNKAI